MFRRKGLPPWKPFTPPWFNWLWRTRRNSDWRQRTEGWRTGRTENRCHYAELNSGIFCDKPGERLCCLKGYFCVRKYDSSMQSWLWHSQSTYVQHRGKGWSWPKKMQLVTYVPTKCPYRQRHTKSYILPENSLVRAWFTYSSVFIRSYLSYFWLEMVRLWKNFKMKISKVYRMTTYWLYR